MPGMSTKKGISILDLRETRNQNLLDGFVDLYNKTFTDPREREDPADWPGRMWLHAPAPQPWTHLLVALTIDSQRVVGGLVFEHYRASHCGLLTYLVIDQGWRRKGIAQALVDKALSTLIQEERDSGGQLRAAFCEVEDPLFVPDERSAMPTCERLHALLSLGSRLLDLKYVQPRLIGGAGACDHLLLLAFDLQDRAEGAVDGKRAENIAGSIVYDFLHEFHRALGVASPEEDPNFRDMARHLRGELTLWDPREKPVLNLKEMAACLHYVQACPKPPDRALPYPGCHVFQSIELDLMSYGYQVQNLLGSQCEQNEPIPIEIEFPERVDYHTEGRHMMLLPLRRTCRARAMVSSTLFLVSGIRVWHVVLRPENDEAFTEFDIIKLIHLYDGRTENTNLGREVKFRVRPGKPGGSTVTSGGLLQTLLNNQLDWPDDFRPTAGTIQIVTVEGDTKNDANLAEVLQVVRTAKTPGCEQEYKNIIRWISDGTPQGKALLSLCGIITGIFDFAEVDEEEALDTLEPTFASPGFLIRINRCTMVSIGGEDRAMAKLKDNVGISPYLLLPHAALLHNEALIEDSESALSEVSAMRRVPLRKLEDACRRMERNLNRFYLPNVFNYITERTLFIRGAEGRGTSERLIATRAKLQELDNRVKASWERRHERGQMRIAALLAVFTVVGLRDVLFDIMKGTVLEPHSWWVLSCLAGVVVFLYILWGIRVPYRD